MATTTLKAASSQPATGLGSLAETNRLLSQGAATVTSPAPKSGGRDELPAGVASQTYNPDGSVRNSYTQSQLSSKNASDIATGKDTPVGVGGELTGQSLAPSSKPIDTAQPSPTTVNATPYTNPVVTAAQAQANLASGGLSGDNLAAAQKSLTASQKGLAAANASGAPAPQSAGVGMSAANTAIGNATPQDTTAIDNFVSQDPNVNKMMQGITQLLNPQQQTTTLLQDYQALYKESGLDKINKEMIDADTVINGTEDDIRNEIQTAGGFGTESQVQAMTLSRNKGLLKRYNQLVQMKTDATNQLNTLSSLNAQDKQIAQQRVNTQIETMFKLADFQQQAQNNIKEGARWNLTNDPQGFYDAVSKDPARLSQMEQVLSLPQGGLKHTAATLASNLSLDRQAKIAQINAANRSNQPAPSVQINPKYSGVLQTILGSGKFTPAQTAQIANSINNGDDPVSVVRNQAKNIMGQTEATSVTKYETAQKAMNDLQSSLAEYYANGGKTGIFSGNTEKVINKLGSVNDPKLVNLATQIQSQLQVYRNAVSGTAYSVQEGKDINSIFPGINKSQGLNTAILDGRMGALQSTIDGTYESTLGSNAYQGVIQNAGGKGSQSNNSFVESALTKNGVNYNSAVSNAPAGKIPVIMNNSGGLGYIYPGEYNSATYTKL